MSETSSKKWTEDQALAIYTGGCNLLVSAAAGAGKTAVLVERIINTVKSLERPVDIDRLLVITYTNAAAAEMRERIASALAGAVSAGREGSRLGIQAALINKAKITTLHSFCLDVLRQYFYKLDLDPGFRVADETEATILKHDVLEGLFEEMYAQDGGEGGFTRLVECYGGDPDDLGLQDLVLKIYDFSRSNPLPDRWLDSMAGKFQDSGGLEGELEKYSSLLLAEVSAVLKGAAADLQTALDLCRRPGGPAVYEPCLREDLQLLEDLAGACRQGWDQACRAFGEMTFGRLKSVGPGVDEGTREQVASLRDGVKKRLKKCKEDYLGRTLGDHRADMERLAPLVSALADLVKRFGHNYRSAKLARGLVDFSDLEHYCLNILAGDLSAGVAAPSEVAVELRDRFEEVLVDEYQDINPVQEAIINLVSRQSSPSPNLFMVGDVKQSIYRFRLADPGLFLEKQRRYPSGGGGRARKINLSKNFRSRPEIIDAVNYIFRNIMSAEAAEIDYDRDAELVCGSVAYAGEGAGCSPDYRVELHILDRSRGGDDDLSGEEASREDDGPAHGEDDSGEEELAPSQAEAGLIASRINEMAGRLQVYDGDLQCLRPARYSDMVILLRATREVAGVFVDELNKAGIPACAETGTGYYESAEIETMLSLLKIIDNPRQDIPLAAVLRSPVVGLGAEDLARVRMADNAGDLWDAVEAAARSGGGELGEKLMLFCASLARWREAARMVPLTDLVWTIYRETGYYYYMGSTPGGEQRQANLRSLHDRASQYEATTFRGIFSFLRFIERLREKGEDSGRARARGESENAVRVMSIHKSKGLEFPVVFVAGLGRKFNLQDLNGNMLLHREMGFGPTLVDTAARVAYPTLARLAVREKLRRETLAEEMRVLYVAMTRAREKLVLTGSVRDLRKRTGLPTITGAVSCLDWLCAALAGHRDGSPLREAGGLYAGDNANLAAESSWLVKISAPGESGEISPQGEARGPDRRLAGLIRRGEKVDSPGIYSHMVDRRLSWVYPYRAVVGKPAKISVTGLGEAAGAGGHGPADDLAAAPAGESRGISFLQPRYARPAFLAAEKELTPAERGTAVHMVMRHLDLSGRLDAESIAGQVAALVTRELITADQALEVNCGQIEEFFASEPGRRLLAAPSVKRELPFGLLVPATEIYPDLAGSSGEKVLVQGVIDCLVEEEDGCLIIDYKTDRRSGWDPGRLRDKYQSQVNLYSRAVEAITGRPVLARYLYFFEWGKYVKI